MRLISSIARPRIRPSRPLKNYELKKNSALLSLKKASLALVVFTLISLYMVLIVGVFLPLALTCKILMALPNIFMSRPTRVGALLKATFLHLKTDLRLGMATIGTVL